MKFLMSGFVISAAALLGGCVVVPPDYAYSGYAPGYYAPAPYYYGPSIRLGVGVYGGRGDYRSRRDGDYGRHGVYRHRH